MNKKIFQLTLVTIGLILTITSFWGIITGAADKFYELPINNSIGNVILDSNLRFYYGLTAGLGLVILWIAPSFEKHSTILNIVSVMIFLGAIGRVVSLITIGNPSLFFIIFTLIELLFPLLIIWNKQMGKLQNGNIT